LRDGIEQAPEILGRVGAQGQLSGFEGEGADQGIRVVPGRKDDSPVLGREGEEKKGRERKENEG
jgi:hypothetical protein